MNTNNLSKTKLLFDFVSTMHLIDLHIDEYYDIFQKKYPKLTSSRFEIGSRSYTNSYGETIRERLFYIIDFRDRGQRLVIRSSGRIEDTFKRIVTYDRIKYNNSRLGWISKPGASMHYGKFHDTKIEYNGRNIELLDASQCNVILQGSTEELEFQLNTLYEFNDNEMIQYGLLSLLTSDSISGMVNVVNPDLTDWKDNYQDLVNVLEKIRQGII